MKPIEKEMEKKEKNKLERAKKIQKAIQDYRKSWYYKTDQNKVFYVDFKLRGCVYTEVGEPIECFNSRWLKHIPKSEKF